MSKRNTPAEDVASVVNRGLPEELQSIVDLDTLDTETYHYRFIQERPQNVARKRSMGSIHLIAEEEGVKTITGEVAADGLIRDGDSILMRVPKARFEDRRKKSKKFTDSRLATVDQQFKKKAKGTGHGGTDVQVGDFNHTYDED